MAKKKQPSSPTVAEVRLENAFARDLGKEFQRQSNATDKMLIERNAYKELYEYARKEHPNVYDKAFMPFPSAKDSMSNVIEKGKHKDIRKINVYLYNWAEEVETEKMKKVMNTNILRAGVQGGRKALKNLNTASIFNLKNKTVLRQLLNRGSKISGVVNKATLDKLRQELYTSYMEKGMSPFDMRKRIKQVIPETYKGRSLTIARTESMTARGIVQEETYKRNGFKKKRWIAYIDGRTRHSHKNVTKAEIPFTEPFVLTDAEGRQAFMHWAHDPNAPAREVVNCRCTCMGAGVDLNKPFNPTWTGQ